MNNAKPKIERIERIITPMPQTLIEEIDDFRFGNRMPSRSQAIRELIRRGLGQALVGQINSTPRRG
jgi:metal-responsive CopG/Arc/MetJ family transcriptional regulator